MTGRGDLVSVVEVSAIIDSVRGCLQMRAIIHASSQDSRNAETWMMLNHAEI